MQAAVFSQSCLLWVLTRARVTCPCPPPPHSLLTQVESCAGNCTSWQAGLAVLLLIIDFEAESLYAAQAALQLTHLLRPPTWPLLSFLLGATGLWVSLPDSRDERDIAIVPGRAYPRYGAR